jgi:hypothetical protein
MESLLLIITIQWTEWSLIWTGRRRFLTYCWRHILRTKMVQLRTMWVWLCFGIQRSKTGLNSTDFVSPPLPQPSFSPSQITQLSVDATMVSFCFGTSESSQCQSKDLVSQLTRTNTQLTHYQSSALSWPTTWLLSQTTVWCVCGISSNSANPSGPTRYLLLDLPESLNPQVWHLLSWTDLLDFRKFLPQVQWTEEERNLMN